LPGLLPVLLPRLTLTLIFGISASQIASIIVMSHWHLAHNKRRQHWESLAVSHKVKHRTTIWLIYSVPSNTSKRIASKYLNKYLYTNFKAVLFTVAEETIQVPINRWRYKQNRAYAQNGIFSYEKD
jgi:hypothetical protein